MWTFFFGGGGGKVWPFSHRHVPLLLSIIFPLRSRQTKPLTTEDVRQEDHLHQLTLAPSPAPPCTQFHQLWDYDAWGLSWVFIYFCLSIKILQYENKKDFTCN